MPRADRIIVVQPANGFGDRPYILNVLADEWRKRGIDVAVTDELLEPTGPDVLVFPHDNLTVTRRKQVELFNGCARVVNRSVTDISKRQVSRNRVTSARAYDKPVIVKTNRNYGGVPEMQAAVHAGGLRRCVTGLSRRLPWTLSGLIEPEAYRIYEHAALVPRAVWHNPRLIVEKFLPEREGELYCLRQCIFLGDREINVRSIAASPIIKSGMIISRELLTEAPAALRAFRAELGFDYGKFDYVMRDGEPVVFDVNRTPTYNPQSKLNKPGSASALLPTLAAGIDRFLGMP